MVEIRPQLLGGPRWAGELAESLGITRAGLLHAYRRETDRVLRFGRARNTRYAARQNLTGLNTDEFPIFRVDETGTIGPAGDLITLVGDQCIWLPNHTVVDGLPPEMHDIAPRGFLGRSFARRHPDLELPDDVSNWSDHHVLIALTRRGEDLPGKLVIGRESFDRFQLLKFENHTTHDFPALAAAALAGKHVGSSAGGQRPKFTCLLEDQHRIVKFATDETDNARRWQDLLTLEHLALETLDSAGIRVAKTRLINVGNLRCLIIDRFDRIRIGGRRSVMTLAAATERVDGPWTDAARELSGRGLLNQDDVGRIALLDAYGAMIANTDRHRLNVLLFPDRNSYSLAPAFDQLPMAYAPPESGHFRNTAVDAAVPTVNTLAVWEQARELAKNFWHRALDENLSALMSKIVREHAER